MKKILMGIATGAMLLTSSCASEKLEQKVDGENFTLKVSMGIGSRTLNDEKGVCLWENNKEEIFVVSEDGSVYGTLRCLEVSEDGKTAKFSGPVNGNPAQLKYTFYPVPEDPKDLTIETKPVEGKMHRAPMFGEIDGGEARFQYAGGLVKLVLKGASGAKVGAVNDGTQVNVMNGTWKFDLEEGKMKFYSNPTTASVELKNIEEDGIVYVPVATEVTTDNTTTVTKIDMNVYVGNSTTPIEMPDVTVGQKKIATNDVPNVYVDSEGNAEPSKWIEDLNGLESAISEGGNYKLKNDIASDGALTIGYNTKKLVSLNLDLNGKTISRETETGSVIFYVGKNGELELENGYLNYKKTATGGGDAIGVVGGNVEIDNVDITTTQGAVNVVGCTDANYSDWENVKTKEKAKSIVNIKNSKFVSTETVNLQEGRYCVQVFYDAYVSFENCEISGNRGAVLVEGAMVDFIGFSFKKTNQSMGSSYGIYLDTATIWYNDEGCKTEGGIMIWDSDKEKFGASTINGNGVKENGYYTEID